MTKHPLVLFLAVALVLGGCIAAPKSRHAAQQQADGTVFPPPPDEPRFYFERTLHNRADVVPDTDSDIFRRTVTGERKTAEGISKPYGIAVHRGRVFVGDTAGRAVVVFDIPGQQFFRIGESDPGMLITPMGMDVDQLGNLYVV
ncbi:MAG: hypothetical protein OEV15_00700, partial [Gallionella sp.]|nr:hypothetical protein [Gallionella sp.]